MLSDVAVLFIGCAMALCVAPCVLPGAMSMLARVIESSAQPAPKAREAMLDEVASITVLMLQAWNRG